MMVALNLMPCVQVDQELNVNEFSNENPAIPEGIEKPRQSPWLMLISLVLLISGLLLTSFLMLFYAWQHTGQSTMKSFDFSALMKRNTTSAPQTAEAQPVQPVAADQNAQPNKALFTKSNGDNVKWPRLKLSGFGTSSDGKSGFAIINGNQVLQGETLGKVTLLEVHAHAVVVEYMGVHKALTMDIDH